MVDEYIESFLRADLANLYISDNSGTPSIEWHVTNDPSLPYQLDEHNEAIMTHVAGTFKKFQDFLDILTPTSMDSYGKITVKVKEAAASFVPIHNKRIGGFDRWRIYGMLEVQTTPAAWEERQCTCR